MIFRVGALVLLTLALFLLATGGWVMAVVCAALTVVFSYAGYHDANQRR